MQRPTDRGKSQVSSDSRGGQRDCPSTGSSMAKSTHGGGVENCDYVCNQLHHVKT